MRVMILNDGATFTALAGCRIAELDDALEGDGVGAAVKAGAYTVVHEFDDAAHASGEFEADERERLRALLDEYATLCESSARLAHRTPIQRHGHCRDAALLRRQGALV